MSNVVTSVVIKESMELPILVGKIEVDTSNGPVTIFMRPGPQHGLNEQLIISKISRDNNMVSLFSETTLINGVDIVMFGLPIYAKVRKGKVKTLHLISDGSNWRIIKEE